MLKDRPKKELRARYFLVIRPVFLKMHISTQLIHSFPLTYGMWSCDKEKLSIPLEAHHKAQLSEIFLFSGKNLKEQYFLSFGQSCWNCIFKRPRLRAFKRRTACQIAAEKSCSSHLFVVVPSRAAQTAFAPELSKAIIFCLRYLSWWNCTFELT